MKEDPSHEIGGRTTQKQRLLRGAHGRDISGHTTAESFTFKQPQEWPKWSAAGLAEKAEEVQVNTLIYTMGDEVDDILRSFKLTDEDKKDYTR